MSFKCLRLLKDHQVYSAIWSFRSNSSLTLRSILLYPIKGMQVQVTTSSRIFSKCAVVSWECVSSKEATILLKINFSRAILTQSTTTFTTQILFCWTSLQPLRVWSTARLSALLIGRLWWCIRSSTISLSREFYTMNRGLSKNKVVKETYLHKNTMPSTQDRFILSHREEEHLAVQAG